MCLSVLSLVALAGCQQPGGVAGAGGPESAKLQPLPAKALVGLDVLKPAVAKPVNPDTATRPVSPQASDALAEAERALAAGDLTKAIERLERASGFEPNNPRIRRSLAMAYASRGDLGKALPNIRVAVKAAPDDLESQALLGKLLASQHLDDEAFIAYRTALLTSQAQPQNPIAAEALYNLAKLLQEDGYWTASLEAYTRLATWIEKYGRGYAGRREMRELALRPERVQTARGQLLMELRRPSEAIEPLQKSFESNRSDLASARLLLEALISTKQYPRAEKLLVDLTGENTQGAQLTMLAELLCRSAGDPAMPGRIWEGFRKKNNINPLLAIALAKISERLGRPADAQAILKSVADSMPGNIPVANALAGVLARQGSSDEAAKALAAAVRRNPEDALQIADGVRQMAFAPRNATNLPQDFAAAFVDGMLDQELGNSDSALKAFAASASQKKDFLAAYEAQVNVHLESNQFDKAQSVVDSLPEKGYFADYLKGKILLAQDKPADAQKVLEGVRKSNAKFAPGMILLAEAYIRQNRADNAVDALFAAIEADPEQMDAYRRMFDVYLAARQYNDAQAVIGRFLERQPQNIQGLIMLAQLNLAINQRPTAMGILSQLLEQAPDNVEVNLLAARAAIASNQGLLSRAQFDEAMKYVDQALKADPRNATVLRVKAEMLGQPGRFAQAAATWKLLCQYSRRDEYCRNYAAACMLSGDYASAVAALEPLLNKNSDLPVRQAFVEALPHTKGGLAKASDLLTQWLKDDLAKDDQRKGWDIDRMIKMYDSATDKKVAGGSKVDVAPLMKAIDDFMASASPQLQSALAREKIRFLVRTEQYDKATLTADAVSEADLKANARLMLSSMLFDMGQFSRGQSLLDGWISSEKDAGRRDRYRAAKILGYCLAGSYDKAQDYVNAWLKDTPQATAPRIYLVDGLVSQRQYDRALKIVEAWLAELSKTAATASAPATKVEPPPADELALPVDPAAFLQRMHVRLLLTTGRNADALKMVDAYLKSAGDDADMLNLKSSALTELGRHDESLAVLEQVLSMRPDDAGANNNLGYMYAEHGKQLEKAEKMLRKALKERPEEPSFLDSLGWILYRQGRTGEAAAILREVVLDQDNEKAMHPVIFDHAGDAYWKLGWTDEAVIFWNKSLELAKNDKDPTSEIKALVKNTSAKLKAVSARKQPQIASVAAPAEPAPSSAPASKPAGTSVPVTKSAPASRAASRPAKATPARKATTTRTSPSGGE